MSQEITVSLNLQLANGNYRNTFQQSGQFDQNSLGVDSSIVTVTTTAAQVTFQNVTTDGMFVLQNLDSANFVEYGVSVSSTFYPLGRIKAGEYQLFRLHPGVAFFAKADTASVLLNYILLND